MLTAQRCSSDIPQRTNQRAEDRFQRLWILNFSSPRCTGRTVVSSPSRSNVRRRCRRLSLHGIPAAAAAGGPVCRALHLSNNRLHQWPSIAAGSGIIHGLQGQQQSHARLPAKRSPTAASRRRFGVAALPLHPLNHPSWFVAHLLRRDDRTTGSRFGTGRDPSAVSGR
ncbi:hypothetical protein BU26DRAFT_291795 [Trematosphaeria pertusa]|uniref:Uncharacterized protein n=1 Tax=Trematosphaeria pertusa TaxID=390896 RepID=A0A6A6IH08_9PLEO|nr:uncharacterized protein BU26DRAFT_291795 [Trematosphaeria pertusa]KAF2249884.1 hypothetical protein BU26DRAFT_291795 [Trematosphaeria pertusa]